MKTLHFLIAAASLAFTTAIHAQDFTGGIAIGGVGSYTSSSLTLGTNNVFESGDGTFAGLSFGFGSIANPEIDGLSGTSTLTLSAPLPAYEISSSTTPVDEYAFEMTSITLESTSPNNVYQGTGEFIDNENVLTPTDATFTLSFSGPNSYSFSADVVQAAPEPSAWALALTCVAFFVYLRRRNAQA